MTDVWNNGGKEGDEKKRKKKEKGGRDKNKRDCTIVTTNLLHNKHMIARE